MGKKVIYPGTFDPVTYGHLDVIKRASKMFDEVVVAVAHNPGKNPLFKYEERKAMLEEAVKDIPNIVIDEFSGLLVNYAKDKGINVIVRGIRAVSDFEFEFQMALTNKKMAPEIETIYVMPGESYSYLSSRIIKEIIRLGGDINEFVPKHVIDALEEKLK